MNVIGIDYQRTQSAIALREGRVPRWPPVAVGDGRGDAVDHAVAFDRSAWGEAASALDPAQWSGALFERIGRPWTAPPAGLFWSAVSRNIRSFIGGDVERVVDSTCIALTTAAFAADAAAVVRLAEQSGLSRATAICSGQAALLAALQGRPPAGASAWPDVVNVIVVADCAVAVHGYRIESAGPLPRIVCAAPAQHIEGTGSAFWADCVIEQVTGACGDVPSDPALGPALRRAAGELGWLLAHAMANEKQCEWLGPLRERMPHPIRISRESAFAWAPARQLAEVLPDLLLQSARHCGSDLPQAVVIVGADWPFPRVCASAVCNAVVVVNNSALAVARGAAWWPALGQRLFEGIDTPAAVVSTPHVARNPTRPPRMIASPQIDEEIAPAQRPPAAAPRRDLADLDIITRHLSDSPPGDADGA